VRLQVALPELARARIRRGVRRDERPVPVQGQEIRRVAPRLEHLPGGVDAGSRIEEIGEREGAAILGQQPYGGPGHAEGTGGRFGEGPPGHRRTGRGHAALEQREQGRLLGLRPKAGGVATAVHPLPPGWGIPGRPRPRTGRHPRPAAPARRFGRRTDSVGAEGHAHLCYSLALP
jgi:hypothetical protein